MRSKMDCCVVNCPALRGVGDKLQAPVVRGLLAQEIEHLTTSLTSQLGPSPNRPCVQMSPYGRHQHTGALGAVASCFRSVTYRRQLVCPGKAGL